MINRSTEIYQRFIRHQYTKITKRYKASPTNPIKNNSDEANLKWTEKKEAPKWLQKMAPTKGGRELPSAKEAVVIGIVMAVGYYSWFVEPPKKEEEHRES